jgi:DNA-binding FadR family transcriptional regulator
MDVRQGGLSARKRQGLAEQVAESLGVRIVSGKLGDRANLPTEAEIQTEFSVSRTAVREAVRLLSAKGLTESRPKIGTRIRPREFWNLLDPDVLSWQLTSSPDPRFLENLFEMRSIFEPEAARLCARHATDRVVAQMESALERMIAHPLGSLEQVDADLTFHQMILEGSGNDLLRSVGSLIESALLATFRMNWSARSTSHPDRMEMHRTVFAFIKAHEPDQAAKAMQVLIQHSKDDSLNAIKNDPSLQRSAH